MTPQDRKAFAETILGFAELKGKQLSAPAIELFWRSMQHWPIEDFKQAAEHLVRTCEFMPTPKNFEDLRKAGRPTAGEAWAEVLAAARSGGLPNANAAAMRALSAIGGIRAVMFSDVDKTQFLERRFCEHFEEAQDACDVREELPRIASEKRLDGPRKAGELIAQRKDIDVFA